MSHYSTLRIAKSASPEDIKKAYRQLAMQYHPDRHFTAKTKEEAEEIFKMVQTAYNVLSNTIKRQQYDAVLNTKIKPARLIIQAHLDARVWFEGSVQKYLFKQPVLKLCSRCGGVNFAMCWKCRGTGRIEATALAMLLPARVYFEALLPLDIDLLDLNGRPLDVYMQLSVASLNEVSVFKHDIWRAVNIPRPILYWGGQWTAPVFGTLTTTVTVPKRTKKGHELRLPGLGLFHEGHQGDMVLKMYPCEPKTGQERWVEFKMFLRLLWWAF